MAKTKPAAKGSGPQESTRRCFVILPFAGEYNDVYHYAIQPVAERFGYLCERVDDVGVGGPLSMEILKRIATADLVIADLSQNTPNGSYELGIAVGVGIPAFLISRTGTAIPFDLRELRVLFYDSVNELNRRLEELFDAFKTEGSTWKSPIAMATPQLDRVPRTELDTAQAEVDSLKRQLSMVVEARPTEPQFGDANQLAAFKLEISDYLKALTADVVGGHARELAAASTELDRLKRDNEQLRSYEAEIRRLKESMVVNPRWPGRTLEVDPNLCFLLMPFSEPWSDDAWKLIENIITGCGMQCRRADEQEGRLVMDDIWDGLRRARVVIADLTNKNPNVTYEVGLADVLGKDVIILSQTPDDVPFDFLGLRLVTYDNSIGGVRKLSDELKKRLERFRPSGAPTVSS